MFKAVPDPTGQWTVDSTMLILLCCVLTAQALSALLHQLRPFFNSVPKAKAAKIVRSIIDSLALIPGTTELQVIW